MVVIAAKAAKNRFIDIVGDTLVTVEMGLFDKYGRILATVYNKDNMYSHLLK